MFGRYFIKVFLVSLVLLCANACPPGPRGTQGFPGNTGASGSSIPNGGGPFNLIIANQLSETAFGISSHIVTYAVFNDTRLPADKVAPGNPVGLVGDVSDHLLAVTNTNGTAVWHDFGGIFNVPGPDGPRGLRGENGTQGIQGIQGIQGVAGPATETLKYNASTSTGRAAGITVLLTFSKINQRAIVYVGPVSGTISNNNLATTTFSFFMPANFRVDSSAYGATHAMFGMSVCVDGPNTYVCKYVLTIATTPTTGVVAASIAISTIDGSTPVSTNGQSFSSQPIAIDYHAVNG